MTTEGNKGYTETPCLECPNMVSCNKMCYKRLEWGVFDADPQDEELHIYGNNILVRKEKDIVQLCTEEEILARTGADEEVKKLLIEFNQLYRDIVVAEENRRKQMFQEMLQEK